MRRHVTFLVFFFFNDTATTEIYTLSLHDALPICEHNGIRLITIHKSKGLEFDHVIMPFCDWQLEKQNLIWCRPTRSEEHTSELQSRQYLVCRLLLEKKKINSTTHLFAMITKTVSV